MRDNPIKHPLSFAGWLLYELVERFASVANFVWRKTVGSSRDTYAPTAGLERLDLDDSPTVAELPAGRWGFVDADLVTGKFGRNPRVPDDAVVHADTQPGGNHPVGRRHDGTLLVSR